MTEAMIQDLLKRYDWYRDLRQPGADADLCECGHVRAEHHVYDSTVADAVVLWCSVCKPGGSCFNFKPAGKQ